MDPFDKIARPAGIQCGLDEAAEIIPAFLCQPVPYLPQSCRIDLDLGVAGSFGDGLQAFGGIDAQSIR